MTTSKGLVKFDGKDFKLYNWENGLPGSVVFSFFEQSPEQVWVSTVENKLFHFNPCAQPVKFIPYTYNDTLVKIFNQYHQREFIRCISQDEQANLRISFLNGPGVISIDVQGNWSLTGNLGGTPNDIKRGLHTPGESWEIHYQLKNNYTCAYTTIDTTGTELLSLTLVNDQTKKRHELTKAALEVSVLYVGVSDYCVTENAFCILVSNRLILIRHTSIQEVFLNSDGLCVLENDDQILVGTRNGLEVFNQNGTKINHYFKGKAITDLLVDRAGKIWFSTSTHGIFYIPNPDICYFPQHQQDLQGVKKLAIKDSEIYVFTRGNLFLVLNHQGDLIHRFEHVPEYRETVSNYSGSDLRAFFGNPLPLNHQKNGPDLYTINSDSLFVRIGVNDINVYRDTSTQVLVFENIPVINAATHIQSRKFLLATNSGLFIADSAANYSRLFPDDPVLNTRLIAVKESGNRWIVTSRDHGIVIISGNSLFHLNSSAGLISDEITAIEPQADSILWIGTSAGLSKVTLAAKGTKISLQNFREEDGLFSEEITDLKIYHDSLWIASPKGIFCIPTQSIQPSRIFSEYPLITDSIRINNKPESLSPQITLEESGILEIYVSQVSFQRHSNVSYEYKIPGITPDWINSADGHFVLSGLAHGDYTLEYRAKKSDFEKGSIHTLLLHVNTPWYEFWWMKLLYVISSLGGIALILFGINRQLRRKKDKEIEKINLELRVLLSQMNPHFTFNTINAIQHYILQNEKRAAINYLSDFASLIRKTLDFSRRNQILWSEEKDYLTLYTSLEVARFEKQIDLQFDEEFSARVDSIILPPLLLQPLVENAIIHGLSGKEGGKIIISIREHEHFFELGVEDNGSGIKPKKRGGNVSHGLNILRQRVALYGDTTLQYFEVFTPDSGGTKVQFRLYKTYLDTTR